MQKFYEKARQGLKNGKFEKYHPQRNYDFFRLRRERIKFQTYFNSSGHKKM